MNKIENFIDICAIILSAAICGFAFSAAIIDLSWTWAYISLVFGVLTFGVKWSMGLQHQGTSS